MSGDIFDMGYNIEDQLDIPHPADSMRVEIYRTHPQAVGDAEPVPELYRNILRHYLSLKSVAFLQGPYYFSFNPVA